MSDNNHEDSEVYIYRGNEKERVPELVEKLIVSEGVQVLPGWLCEERMRLREVTLPNGLTKIGDWDFHWCENLLEITICNTVQFIGDGAFKHCEALTKVEFEFSTFSPHQLQTIDVQAFAFCNVLLGIKLPSSVISVGGSTFDGCNALVEANLSKTSIVEISYGAFANCPSLQTVSLPNTLKLIGGYAFGHCEELVAVQVPRDSLSIRIEDRSFHACKQLANLQLPKDSTAKEGSFAGCDLLHEHYGDDSFGIVAGLMGRFENYPIHRMCYDHSKISDVHDLQQCLEDYRIMEVGLLVDEFGMNPYHVFFSTIEPRVELLYILLESLPNYQLLKCKDANGRRPLDYLIRNWTDGTKYLFQRALQKSMMDPLAQWGAASWMETAESKVQEILAEDNDKGRRESLCDGLYSLLEHYENVHATSILEMALWKWKLATDGTELQADDREESRFLSGSNIVIPHVTILLSTPPADSSEEDSHEGDY